MKIWFFSINYLPNTGGLISYIRNFGSHLKKVFNVEVVTTDGKNKNLKESEVIDDIRVRRLRTFNFNKIMYLFAPLCLSNKIKKELEKIEFSEDDILIIRHVYFAYALSNIVNNNNKKIYIIPLIAPKLQMINMSQANFFQKWYYLFITPQLYFLEKRALKKIDYIGVLSESKKSEIEKFYKIMPEKIKVIPPGVDILKYKPLRENYEKVTIFKKLKSEDFSDKKILLTVCRLVSEKNIDFLLRAIKFIKYENFVLFIVGDGPLRDNLGLLCNKLKINSKVVFWGNRDDVELFYRVSDVFILPSKYEGFGHVYLEALASGVPVIGLKNTPPSIITASEEIIQHGYNGYIVDGNHERELANAIETILVDDITLGKMKVNARDTVLQKFSWDKHLKSILDIVGGVNK